MTSKVIFLSDATAAIDCDDQGALSAAEVNRITLIIIGQSTADVMTVDEFFTKLTTDLRPRQVLRARRTYVWYTKVRYAASVCRP